METTGSSCDVTGHLKVRKLFYTAKKCSVCKKRCLFRAKRMVKCSACKCVMHKKCLASAEETTEPLREEDMMTVVELEKPIIDAKEIRDETVVTEGSLREVVMPRTDCARIFVDDVTGAPESAAQTVGLSTVDGREARPLASSPAPRAAPGHTALLRPMDDRFARAFGPSVYAQLKRVTFAAAARCLQLTQPFTVARITAVDEGEGVRAVRGLQLVVWPVPTAPAPVAVASQSSSPITTVAIARAVTSPPSLEPITAFDYLKSLWGSLPSEQKELHTHLQKLKIAPAPLIIKSKLTDLDYSELSESWELKKIRWSKNVRKIYSLTITNSKLKDINL